MIEDVLAEARDRMQKAIDHLQTDLASVRTGRASPSLVERLPVEQYGTEMPLNQLATIAAPEARLLTISPWDKSSLGAIEKAIRRSDLGFNPSNDGTVIRIAIPPLTEERRRAMVKIVHDKVEQGRIAIRNIRRDAMSQAREFRDEKMISDDDERRAEGQIEELTKKFVAQADQLGKAKEQDLMAV